MQRSYKYRLYPNKAQSEVLGSILHFCRLLYNSALEERISFYKKYKKPISWYDQNKSLIEIKELFPEETKKIHSQSLQGVLKQLDVAYQGFFRRIKVGTSEAGFPRYKGRDRFRSICFPQVAAQLNGIGGVKRLPNNKLKVFGIPEEIKVIWHRPWKGRCKQARIIKQDDQYYLSLSCDDVPEEPLPKTDKVIGIDLGLNTFITGDDGLKIHHPKPLKECQEQLSNLQRRLALKKRGSNNRKRLALQIAKKHNKIKNIREDFQHKVSKKLVENYDTIIFEDLSVNKMMQSKDHKVKKNNLTEASFGNFVAKVTYKAESADKAILLVNPYNTSKTCSGCGNIKENLSLSDRIYHCDACGIETDRDLNAAINIKRLGTSRAIILKV